METKPIDNAIESFIKAKVATKERVSFAEFLHENVEMVMEHTSEDQFDAVDRILRSRFGKIAQKLKVSVETDKRGTPSSFQKAVNALAKKLVLSAKSTTKQEYAKSTPGQDSGTSSSAASKDNSHILTAEAIREFDKSYETMKKEKKWEVCNGVYIEDLMYAFGKKSTHEHCVHSFILDTGDKVWEKELDEQTLHTIRTFGDYELPSLDKKIQDFFDAYDNQPEDGVLDFLIAKTNELGPFDPRTSPDLYKLKNIVERFIGYYVDDVFQHVHMWSEEDFVTHLWAPLDQLFHSSKIITTRNQTCTSTSLRVNGERSISGSSLVGEKKATVRPDLVLLCDGLEYGCSEIGTNLFPVADKKEIVESKLHSPKIMKDMLNFAIAHTKDENTARKIKVVCFNHTGLSTSLSVMDSPAGYVSRIAETKRYKIPVHPEYMVSKLFPILKIAMKAKAIVDQSISVMRRSQLVVDEIQFAFEDKSQKLVLTPCLTSPILPVTRKRTQQSNQNEAESSKRRSTSKSTTSAST